MWNVEMTKQHAVQKGGAWLHEAAREAIFTPERISDEHRLIRQTADEFVIQEVLPHVERLESKDWAFVRALVAQCGELGLLGTDVPDEFGGTDLDKVSSLIVSESVGRLPSWAVTFGGQTGLSITPLLCFGTPDQQARYLPRLVSGEMIGAYALSETGSGSDALGARCRATRLADGGFVLSGEKMWITNGGFADLFTVFAKVDGEHFTAFLVERGFTGVSTGQEEHKMGLHGSSTTPLILQDVKVPAENVLGEIGRGHKVAFNVLNYGRFKLGAMCSGGARSVMADAAKYAAERRQFGRPIGEFGAIRHKLAEMCIRLYATESMLYRVAGQLDECLASGMNILAALEELAVEASIIKVAGSEMMDLVVDENVQIHGGNGFVRDYAAERHYRDARVNRIFEGTNEINRTLIPTMLARRMQQEGGLAAVHAEWTNEGMSIDEAVNAIRGASLIALTEAAEHFGKKLGEEQQVLMHLADMLIDTFACDSVVARARAGGEVLHQAVAAVFVSDAIARVHAAARNLARAGSFRLRPEWTTGLRAALEHCAVDTISARQQIAEAVLSRRAYPFA
jgi:alkylation response protein AidB-like acyl-CoA dehydrogenase